ncbi:uracil-DNA glycosylase [Longispora albida]|uniref:uracil-DNA glycosylase n=1 Tax=Longispora albida TaxID=203523 RepID=UPI00036BFC68|nr:uracil-DNA glycosylase [Longispora albida]
MTQPPGEEWRELATRIKGCVRCRELAAVRNTVVVGEHGQFTRRLALVGEAPGAQEDATGKPFVGRSGQLLDQLLSDAGLSRSETAVLGVIKCRPPGNRTPKAPEIANCRPWLETQLTLLNPRVIVALGLTAAAWFLGTRVTLAQVRGAVHNIGGRAVVVTYHPAAAARFGPNGKPLAALRDDLALAARLLGEALQPDGQ